LSSKQGAGFAVRYVRASHTTWDGIGLVLVLMVDNSEAVGVGNGQIRYTRSREESSVVGGGRGRPPSYRSEEEEDSFK